jgi:hypothetical protein
MYAHVTAGTVDSVGNPPQLVFSGGRWWDLRTLDAATLASVGWFPVQEAAKPADTATLTWLPVFTPQGATVVQSWSSILLTAEQIAERTATTNAATIRQLLTDTMPLLDTITNTTNANMSGNTAAAAIKDEARALRRIIRVITTAYDATS